MAVLTATPIFKVYQMDGINNIPDDASGILPGDGSMHDFGQGVGNEPGITTMQPGSQPSGSNVGTQILNDVTIQRATCSFGGNPANPTLVFTGLQSDSTQPVPKSGSNSLQNDVSSMVPAGATGTYANSVPAPAAGTLPSDGKSQAPNHE